MTKVLVISSEMDTVHLLQVKLSKDGYEVISARTGDEGREQLRLEKPEVVIVDPQVPGERSSELISNLKKGAKPAPAVIVLSSEAGIADISAALAHGADDFVGQPFSPQGLLERMRVTLVRTGKLPAESEGS
jgi:DNA-binding response OmpR family regulator